MVPTPVPTSDLARSGDRLRSSAGDPLKRDTLSVSDRAPRGDGRPLGPTTTSAPSYVSLGALPWCGLVLSCGLNQTGMHGQEDLPKSLSACLRHDSGIYLFPPTICGRPARG